MVTILYASSQSLSRIQVDANSGENNKRRENNLLVAPGSFDWQISTDKSTDKSLWWIWFKDGQKTPFQPKSV